MAGISLSTKNGLLCAFVILTAAIITFAANAIYVNGLTDGRENYTGIKLEAANLAFSNFSRFDNIPGGTLQNFSKLRVKEITYDPSPNCTDVNEITSYSYTLETISWYGIKIHEKHDSICRLFGARPSKPQL